MSGQQLAQQCLELPARACRQRPAVCPTRRRRSPRAELPVTGARAGGISNILYSLQSTLTSDQLKANLPYLISDVINYEDPQARAAYQQYIGAVTARYKDSPAIGGWILGNEYAYFDLWEHPIFTPWHRFLGYDSLGQQSFQTFLRSLYQTNIAALNANWQAGYSDFSSVPMALEYPPDRRFPGFYLPDSMAQAEHRQFCRPVRLAARQADPNHLLTYSYYWRYIQRARCQLHLRRCQDYCEPLRRRRRSPRFLVHQ